MIKKLLSFILILFSLQASADWPACLSAVDIARHQMTGRKVSDRENVEVHLMAALRKYYDNQGKPNLAALKQDALKNSIIYDLSVEEIVVKSAGTVSGRPIDRILDIERDSQGRISKITMSSQLASRTGFMSMPDSILGSRLTSTYDFSYTNDCRLEQATGDAIFSYEDCVSLVAAGGKVADPISSGLRPQTCDADCVKSWPRLWVKRTSIRDS